jgi:hypothetical protein
MSAAVDLAHGGLGFAVLIAYVTTQPLSHDLFERGYRATVGSQPHASTTFWSWISSDAPRLSRPLLKAYFV